MSTNRLYLARIGEQQTQDMVSLSGDNWSEIDDGREAGTNNNVAHLYYHIIYYNRLAQKITHNIQQVGLSFWLGKRTVT